MGKFPGFMGRNEREAPESPHPASTGGKAPSSSGGGPLQQHSSHAAASKSLVSPCGKPQRYSDDSDEDKQFVIPAVVANRLQSPPPPAPSPPPAQADATQQQYTRLAGKMISMVNELRSTGADVALELPTVVIVGQQSAGKSSVVEAICGIPLPRNTDTCTRCPTEVRLSQQPPPSGASWEAVVKLRRENGQSLPAAQAAAAWQLQQHQPQHPQQQQQHHQQAQQQPHAMQQDRSNSMFSPMSSGMLSPLCSVNTSPVGSRQPSAINTASDAMQSEAGLSLETVFRAGITSPNDLPAAVAAAQAALLSQAIARHSSSGINDTRRISSHSSLGRGATFNAANATVDAASRAADAGAVGPLKFSRDVVVVEVRGAVVDLTLFDLPGIIHSVERTEDEHYKHLVADLASSYMRRPGVVIVATITCKEDIDTQVILSMAREVDPQGERTLGVLTKPDQVEEGCHSQWLQVLAGERYPLALGWYVVRNPNQAALVRGTSGAMARQQEETFFGQTPPWSRLPGAGKGRLGTLKLREAMSKQLVRMVAAARPALMAAAQAQLTSLRAELAAMPPAAVLGDGHAEMLRLIDDVSMSIQEEVLARSQSKQFYQHLLTNFQKLKTELAASRPCFLLPRGGGTGSAANGGSSYLVVTCALDDDLAGAESRQPQLLTVGSNNTLGMRGTREDGATTPTGNARAHPGSFDIFSANSGSSGGNVNNSSKPGLGVFIGNGVPGSSQASALVLAACPHQVLLPPDGADARRGMTLEDVRTLVERHHSIELPGFSPYSSVQDLVGRHQRGWGAAAAECAAAAHRQLLQLVMLHVGRTFDRFPRAAEHIRELATELLEELHSDTTAAVDSLVAMELSGAFAVARREFSRASNQHLEGLRTLMAAAGSTGSTAAGADGAAGTLCSAGESRPGLTAAGSTSKRRLAEQGALGAQSAAVPPHTTGLYEPNTLLAPIPATTTGPGELLSMMAVVLTYYSLSCRRLADTVSMSIMHHLISSFNAKFRARLAAQLLSLSTESVGALLVEDGQCAARRASLKAKKDLLEQAMKVMRAAG